MWLLATNRAKLKNFTTGGAKVKLLGEPESDASNDHPVNGGIVNSPEEGPNMKPVTWSDPLVDAERRIPSAWKTVDRVLDAFMFLPRNKRKAGKGGKKGKTKIRVESDDDASEDSESERQRADAYDNGEQPGDDYLQTVQAWEQRTKQQLTVENADQVIWAFFKWDDLGYEEGTRTYRDIWSAYCRLFSQQPGMLLRAVENLDIVHLNVHLCGSLLLVESQSLPVPGKPIGPRMVMQGNICSHRIDNLN